MLDRYRRWREATPERDLLKTVRAAKKEVRAEVREYRRGLRPRIRPSDGAVLVDQLAQLEEALKKGEASTEMVDATERTLMRFPDLVRPAPKAAGRPREGTRTTNLLQLRNKLVEARAGKKG